MHPPKNRACRDPSAHAKPKPSQIKTLMTIQTMSTTIRILALAGSLSLLATSSSSAAFANLPSPTDETPGVLLGAVQATGGGTVLSVLDRTFDDGSLPTPFAQGTLRSFVVDRGAGLLDFYYQLVNTTPPSTFADPDKEFYRIKTTGGFNPSLVVSVGQTNSLAGLVAGPGSGFVPGSYVTGSGLKPALTADRDVATIGSAGFDFPTHPPDAFVGDPKNIGAGQLSTFLVVRTNSTVFGRIEAAISGSGTSFATTFAAIPEPSSVVFGIALLGTCFGRGARMLRRRK